MKNLILEVDLVEEIAKITIKNSNFNPNEWCWNDARTLRIAARVIERGICELEELQTKALEKVREDEINHPPLCSKCLTFHHISNPCSKTIGFGYIGD